ncbi:MAG: T9SS type A sorting domain-containing protein [Sphingobacteriales bacterium]|nr:MAG: T9SS type A sorting domain-containing protein [Sphingobacteriales bacterium]
MKKTILLIFCLFIALSGQAQTVTDTVSLGAGYANQLWYSLSNDEQGSAPKNNWDLAFDVSSFGSSIRINSITGTTLWKYPNEDISGWETLDTVGLYSWESLWNSDTSWAMGAFEQHADLNNEFDLGWGYYSTVTHIVSGDSLYVIQLSDGSFKKLWIESLSGGAFNFRHANLDGSSEVLAQIVKSQFNNKNFAYYSFQDNLSFDREPVSDSWDLLFSQYTAFIPDPYTVTGVLSNKEVAVAEASNIGNTNDYNDWQAHSFVSQINEIGYDWKTFGGTGFEIADSLIYFVKDKSDDIWKLIFTGFGGSANGNFIFTKERLSSVSIYENNTGKSIASLVVYPNPAPAQQVTLVYNLEQNTTSARLTITDIAGKTAYSESLPTTSGLKVHQPELPPLSPGTYIVSLFIDGNVAHQKLIIQ